MRRRSLWRGVPVFHRRQKHGVFSVGRRADGGRAEGEGLADQASGKVGKGLDPMAEIGLPGPRKSLASREGGKGRTVSF